MTDVVLAPQPPNKPDRFREASDAFRHRHAVDGVFLGSVAKADAEQEATTACDVEEGRDLGQFNRIVQRQQGYIGAEPQALSLGRDPLQQGQLREEMEAWGDVV